MNRFYENEVTDMVDAKHVMKDAEKTVDTANKKLDGVSPDNNKPGEPPKATKECGEEKVRKFLDSIAAANNARAQSERFKMDPVVKQRILANQSTMCRNQCIGYMLGSIYLKSLPLDKEYIDAHDTELRNDFGKYLGTKSSSPLFYVKDAFEKSRGTNLSAKRLLEAADDEVKNFHEIMGIDFKNKSADDIKFNLDKDIKDRLDKVTGSLSFDEIIGAIRTNVTNAAVDEIDRAKKEAEEQQALEDELAKNTEITSESAADEWMKTHRTPRPKFYQPTLFEAMLINKTQKKTPGKTYEEIFSEAVMDYTKISVVQSFEFERHTPDDIKRLASRYACGKIV